MEMHGALLCALGLFALAGLLFVRSHRELERRVRTLTEQVDAGSDSARRAHERLDNHQRQVEAIGRVVGWVDARVHTRVIDPAPRSVVDNEP